MSKRIKAKTPNGQELWILSPNIILHSFASNPKKVTFLEIFYFFAQILTRSKKGLNEQEKKNHKDIKSRILIELDNKVVALKFLAKECKKQGTFLLTKKDERKKIYDYKPYQVFLTLIESYLDTLHSINDCISELDKFLGQKFAQEIYNNQWFLINMDLRNVFHHNQSPLLTIQKNKIIFTFNRLPKNPKYLNLSMQNKKGQYEFILDYNDLGDDILNFLNIWAKKYIDLINEDEKIETITGHYKDGRLKSKKIILKNLKTMCKPHVNMCNS